MDSPCSRRLFEQCGVEILIRCGFQVTIWDITHVIHPTILDRIHNDNPVSSSQCMQFDTKQDLIASLSKIPSDTIVNCFTGYRFQTHFIFRELSRNGIPYCIPQMITFPLPRNADPGVTLGPFGRIATLWQKLLLTKPKHLMTDVLTRVYQRHYRKFGVRAARFALLTGEKSFDFIRDPIDENTLPIWAHALDYDLFLQLKDRNVTADPTFAVYIDEYFPLHSDLAYLDTPCPVPAEEYYRKLRVFFEFVEKTLQVRIVIAAHPKSDYLSQPDFFAGRSIIKGRTAELVQEASFVLTHMSTAVNFAILFRKPIIFMTMDKFEEATEGRLVIGPYIGSIARALNTQPVNIDHFAEFDLSHGLKVDIPCYEKYQNDYIKKEGSPQKPFWEIFAEHLS